MANKVEFKAKIEKLTRKAGSVEAQIVVTVPASESGNIPLGAVVMSVQSLQSAMFGANTDNDSAKTKVAKVKNSRN